MSISARRRNRSGDSRMDCISAAVTADSAASGIYIKSIIIVIG